MIESPRIGVIGGNGWLGGAMASAWLAAGAISAEQLILSSRSSHRGAFDAPGVRWTTDNRELVAHSDVVFLSVRPDQFADVNIDASAKLVVSVMAGVPSSTISMRTKAVRVVRAMPNAAASLGKSFTPWFASAETTDSDKTLVQRLISACGEAEQATHEHHIDYCVGLTGSGAAFPALLAQALIEAAIAEGLPPAFARRAALGVVADASQLLRADGADPAEIVREMIDYRGTTAAALNTMNAQGFKPAVRAGLEAAARKAASMRED